MGSCISCTRYTYSRNVTRAQGSQNTTDGTNDNTRGWSNYSISLPAINPKTGESRLPYIPMMFHITKDIFNSATDDNALVA